MALGYVIILIFAGLGILLYGMSLFSRALEACMGHSLNNKFMKVAAHPYQSYFMSAGLTFCTQKSILVSNMIMNYVNIGTLSLKKSIPFIMGLSFGNTLSVIILIFQGFNITAVLTSCCFVGAVFNIFAKTEKHQNIAKALVGFGMLFLGLQLVGTYAEELFAVESIFNVMSYLNSPILIMLLAFGFSLLTTSNFASLTILASLVLAGPVAPETACLGMLAVAIGTSLASYLYTTAGQPAEAKRVAVGHILAHLFGLIILAPLVFTGVYNWLYEILGNNITLTLIIVHMVQMTLPIVLVPLRGVVEKLLRLLVRERRGSTDNSREFILPDSMLETFGTGYLGLLDSTKKILARGSEIQSKILTRIQEGKDMRGVNGEIATLNKGIKISNNAILRLAPKTNAEDMQKSNVLVSLIADLTYLNERSKKFAAIGAEVVKKPKTLSKVETETLVKLNESLAHLTNLDIALIDDIINGKTIDSDALKCVLDFNKQIYSNIQEQRKEVYLDFRKNGHYPEGNAYFNALVNFETVNTSLENIAIKLGILSG